MLASLGCDHWAAPLTLNARSCVPREEDARGGIFPSAFTPSCAGTLPPFSSRLELGSRSLHPGAALPPPPPSPITLLTPSLAYLSWRCTHRTTKLKSHPSAWLRRLPAKQGAPTPARNQCFRKPWRSGLGPAKLAGGRQGRWLGSAGCRALGSRSGKQPRPPRPQPTPPPRTAAARGLGPEPRCGCAPPELGRERGAPPLPQVALGACADPASLRGSRAARILATGAARLHAPAFDTAPRCGLPKLPQFIPAGSEASQPACVRSLGEHDLGGVTECSQSLLEKQLLAIHSSKWVGR